MIKSSICKCALSSSVWLAWVILSSFTVNSVASVSYRELIPEPVFVMEKEGSPFVVNEQTKVIYPRDCPEWGRIAEFLTDYVSERTG